MAYEATRILQPELIENAPDLLDAVIIFRAQEAACGHWSAVRELDGLIARATGRPARDVNLESRRAEMFPELVLALQSARWFLADVSPSGAVKQTVDAALARAEALR